MLLKTAQLAFFCPGGTGRQNPQNSRFVSFKGDLLEYGLVYKITFIFSVSAKTAVTGKLRLGLCWEFIFRNIE